MFALLDLSTPDLLIIFAIIMLLFGSSRLPQLSRGIGESLSEFRKGFSDSANSQDSKKTTKK